MNARFSGLAALAALGLTLSALAVPTTASAAPIIKVAVGAPAIVATTPKISVSIGRPLSPGPNWVWVDGYWTGGHHSYWVKGFWDWQPPARVVTIHTPIVHRNHAPVVRHKIHHSSHHRTVRTHRR